MKQSSSDNNKDPRNVERFEDMTPLISAYNNFAFRLFADILSSHLSGQKENIFFSPLSIATDLAMLYNAASNENQKAIARMMGIQDMKGTAFNQANAVLQAALEKSLQKNISDVPQQNDILYSCVNALWTREQEAFVSEFEAMNRKFYHTEAENLSDDPYGDTATINGWVSSQTKYLPAILRDIYPHATCFILNTLFFKRDWYWSPDFFQKNRGVFNLSKEKEAECIFFSPVHSLDLPYYQGKDFEAVCLPYQENRKCIYFFLPENLTDFLQNHLNNQNWKTWMPEFSMANGEIHLPRINIECETNLADILNLRQGKLAELHMHHRAFLKLFPCSHPDHNLLLSDPHKNKEAENEKEESVFRFVVDRPFFCVIQDEETGMILFMGAVRNPSSVFSAQKESVQVVCVPDDMECFDLDLESASDDNASDLESISDDTGDLDLDLDNIIEYDERPIIVESTLPEYIDTEMMQDIETELDNNLRELYEVYKNGEAEPSDCIAGASSCITLCDEKIIESDSDGTDLDDIDLDGLELDLLEEELHRLEDITGLKEDNPFSYLIRHHLLTLEELKEVIERAKESKDAVEKYLRENLKISQEKILASWSAYYGIPYICYESNIPLDPDFANLVQEACMETAGWVPLFKSEDKVVVAIDEPENREKQEAVKALFPEQAIDFRMACKEDILKFISNFNFIKKGRIFGGISDKSVAALNPNKLEKELQVGIAPWEIPVTEDIHGLVSQIIRDAYFQNVTDIHIEQQSEISRVIVRGRMNEVCRDYPVFVPHIFGYPMIRCIKEMAGLNILKRSISQSGNIWFGIDETSVLLQVVTYPTWEGTEDAVIRFLKHPEQILLCEMGLSKRDYQGLIDAIQKPYGIILMSGHGSDTTFHSVLNELNRPERKIFIAEEPIESVHKGIRQIRLDPIIGFDRAAALQTILQAGPDVIGLNLDWHEDTETLRNCVNASLKGHLVLLRCDSPNIMESSEFADALLCIFSQTMIQTLCKHCKEPYTPSKEEFDTLVDAYGKTDFENNPPEYPNGEPVKYSENMVLYRKKGCSLCSDGYMGNIAVCELFMGSDEIRELIRTDTKTIIRDGIKQDAIAKIFTGYTDLAQVKRIFTIKEYKVSL